LAPVESRQRPHTGEDGRHVLFYCAFLTFIKLSSYFDVFINLNAYTKLCWCTAVKPGLFD